MNSSQEKIFEGEMQYSEYAPHYDNLCEINPAYQELVHIFLDSLPAMDLPNSPTVADLGAGTGNFICPFLSQIPGASVTHLDCSPEMNVLAKKKYLDRGLSVNIVEAHMEDWEFESDTLDLIICVNVLNNAPPALPMLKKMHRWLKPNGTLFLINFGREIKIIDWTWYLLKDSLRNRGPRATLRSIYQTRKAFSSNKAGKDDQKAGKLWTHSSEELRVLVEEAGYDIQKIQTCYRNYADLIVGQKSLKTD